MYQVCHAISLHPHAACLDHYLLQAFLTCCSLQELQKEGTASQTHCCSFIPAGDHNCCRLHTEQALIAFGHALQAPASKQTTASILQEPAEVVQLYRYPGLSKSAAAALLRKVNLSNPCLIAQYTYLHSNTVLLQMGIVLSGAANSELRH